MNIKCDGNHGGPRCGDPGCWNDDPRELENEVRLLHDRLNAITMWAINEDDIDEARLIKELEEILGEKREEKSHVD